MAIANSDVTYFESQFTKNVLTSRTKSHFLQLIDDSLRFWEYNKVIFVQKDDKTVKSILFPKLPYNNNKDEATK